MSRSLAIGIAIASLSLLAGRARADDCLCLGSALLFEPIDQVETSDAYVDEGELDAQGARDEADRRVIAVASAPHPVMWCLSSDDPRCSRDDDSGEAAHRNALSTPPVIPITQPAIPPPGEARVRFEAIEDRGSSSIHTRLERPPRP